MIISFSGLKGSGKDTAADVFEKYLPGARRVSFAGKLKEVCRSAFALGREQVHEKKEEQFIYPRSFPIHRQKRILEDYLLPVSEANKVHSSKVFYSGREILQYVGTDFLRAIDDEIHLKNCPLGGKGENTIVTDARFENEIDFLKNYAFNTEQVYLSYYILRAGQENSDGHSSEQLSQELCRFVIVNDSSLEVFKNKLARIARDEFNKKIF